MAVTEMMEIEEAEETRSKRSVKRKRSDSTSKKEKEDVCFICFESFDGGNNLLACDHRGCTKVYHPACVDRDESIIIPCKRQWNCGWHICSSCEKSAAHYMCYMCTYSLCKSCSKEADFLCATENKGFCMSCMSNVNQIEKTEQGTKEMVQVCFDDKSTWEYLFKDYWVHLKGRLSLNLDILTQVGSHCKESGGMAHKGDTSKEVHDDDQICKSNSSSGNIEQSNSETKKARGQLNCSKEEDLASMRKTVSDAGISITNDTEWATKDLLDFVAHVKNGDLSVLSLSGVQALVLGYIKQNNLRDPIRPNVIVCDSKLGSLFGKACVKHFEMLRLLKSHLILKSSKEIYDANYIRNDNSGDSSEILELSLSETRNVNGKSNALKEVDSVTVGNNVFGEAISISNSTNWASKELLEFVTYMKNGDLSIMSLFDVQNLLFDYIQLKNLRDPIRKSQIFCDSRLHTLFGKQCVMHFEMLRLVESHLLVNKDIQSAEIHGGIVDIEAGKLDADSTGDPQTKMVADKRCKTWKKDVERGPWAIFFDYAAICVHNLNLIFLKRTLLEDLLEDDEKFEEKVISSFVRIKIPGFSQRKDLHRLVRVVGAKRVAEPYKVGMRTTDVMLEIQNLNERKNVSIEDISDQEFTEDECVDLHQSIKCGFVCPLRVGEIQQKVMALQVVRVNNCLQKEILQLCNLRDRANEKGRKKEFRECLKKLQILETPEERSRRLKVISEVHADAKMDPNYVSEADEEPDDKTPDCCKRARDGGFSMKGRDPSSPEKGISDSHDGWSGANINSIADQEASRTMFTKDILKGDNDADAGDSPRSQGRDAQNTRCEQSYNQGPATGSESGASNDQAHLTSGPSSVILPQTAVTSLPAASSHPAAEVLCSTISDTKSCHGNEEGRRKHTSRAKCDEELNNKIWHYQDPSGKIQGPYSIVQLRKWCRTGYFPANLRLWRTTENQDQDSILMTDALNGKFLKDSPHSLANGVSQALCLQQKTVSEPNEPVSLVNSFVSGSPADGDNLTPLSGLVFPVAIKGAADLLLPGSQDDPSTSLHSSIPEANPGRARHPLCSTDARQSPLSTMIDLHGVSQCDFLDLPNESGLPAFAEVGEDFLPGSMSDPSTSLHSASPEADQGRANNLFSSTDAREIPQVTMIDDTHRVSLDVVFDRPNELEVQFPTGAEVDEQIGSSEVSIKTQTLVPEPLALASSGTLMHTVADPVSGRNSPSNDVSTSVLCGEISVGKHELQGDNHVLQPCSTQKLEIDSRHGIESLGLGSVLSQRLQEPSSNPVPLPVSQMPEEPHYGHRDDNGPSSFNMFDGSFGTKDQTGYPPSPRFSVSDSVPPCNWTGTAITESADGSASSFSAHGNNSTPLSRMAIETNPHMQSSVPSTNLDVRVLENPNNGRRPTPKCSNGRGPTPKGSNGRGPTPKGSNGRGPTPKGFNTSCVPGPHQGNTNTRWGVSRQRRRSVRQGYTLNPGAIPPENNMGCRVAPQVNTDPRRMPWGNHIPSGAAGAVLLGGANNDRVAASHGNATGYQGTKLCAKNTGWHAPTGNINPRTMIWGNHISRGAVLQGGDNNIWAAASHGNATGYQGTMLPVKSTGWHAPTANIDSRTMLWEDHMSRGAVLQGGDSNAWVAASHMNTTGGQGVMWHVNNNVFHAPAVDIGNESSQERGNGGRSFGQCGRGSHGEDSGHGGGRPSWNMQSRFGGTGGRGTGGFSGPLPQQQECLFYKTTNGCKWGNKCIFLHLS